MAARPYLPPILPLVDTYVNGIIAAASLFRIFPTHGPTGQARISAAGYRPKDHPSQLVRISLALAKPSGPFLPRQNHRHPIVDRGATLVGRRGYDCEGLHSLRRSPDPSNAPTAREGERQAIGGDDRIGCLPAVIFFHS
jgi:hypothetical protein